MNVESTTRLPAGRPPGSGDVGAARLLLERAVAPLKAAEQA